MKSKKIKSLLLSAVVAVTSALSFGAVTASAASPVEFKVASVDAAPGETVDVTVSLANNPGTIGGLTLKVTADEGLTLTKAEYKTLFADGVAGDDLTKQPYTINWMSNGSDPLAATDGTLATFTYTVAEDAKGEMNVTAAIDEGDFFDMDYEDLEFKITSGKVSIACKEHKWSEWTTVTESTCKEAGKKTRKCTVCGKEETADLELAAHTLTKTDAVAASCKDEKDGTEAYWKCSVCGKMFSDADGKTEITAPVAVKWAHKWGDKVETKAATCTEKGEATAKCENCGKEDTIEIAALGHDWSAWKVTKEATTEEEGEEERTCSRCEEKETKVIPVKAADPEPDTPVDEDENNNNDFNWFVAPSYDPNAVNLGNRESAAASDAGTTPAASADEKETEVKADDKDQNDAVVVEPTDDTNTDADTGDNGADIEIEDDNTDIAIDGDDGVDTVVDETPDDNSGSANSETDAAVVSNAESSNPVTGVASNVGVAVVFGLIAAGAGAFAITKKTRK
jgi:hypothetical protein